MRLSRTVTIILLVLGGFVLLGVGTCGVAYVWFRSNEQELKAQAERLGAEAKGFAAGADKEGCLHETLRRMNACDPGELVGSVCRGKLGAFFKMCLRHARPTAGFCDGVPRASEILDTVSWSMARCEGLGRPGDQGCTRLVAEIGRHCFED